MCDLDNRYSRFWRKDLPTLSGVKYHRHRGITDGYDDIIGSQFPLKPVSSSEGIYDLALSFPQSPFLAKKHQGLR
jgi:hypothetical protein